MDNYSIFLDDLGISTNNERAQVVARSMEHEEKSAPVTPDEVGRTRVVSAAVDGQGVDDQGRVDAQAVSGRAGDRPAVDGVQADAPARSAGPGVGEVTPRNRPPKKGPGSHPNNVRRLRIERMMSKAELARRANVSVLTIDRVEKAYGCRMDTKRKILEALGLTLGDRVRVFGEEE